MYHISAVVLNMNGYIFCISFSICFEDRMFELKEKKEIIHVNIMLITVILNSTILGFRIENLF